MQQVNFGLLGGTNINQQMQQGLKTGAAMADRRTAQEEKQKSSDLATQLQERMNNPDFQLASSTDFNELQKINPQLAQASMKNFESMSKKRQENYIADMVAVRDAAASGNIQRANELLQGRVLRVTKDGGDPVDSARALKILNANPDFFIQGVDNMIEARTGFDARSKGKAKTNFAPDVSPVQVDQATGGKYVIITDRNTMQSRRQDILGASGLTEEMKIDKDLMKTLRSNAIQAGDDAFKQINGISKTIKLLEEAEKQLGKGADTGVFANLVPSFAASTQRLEQTAFELGIDIINSATFGALSEKELELALRTGLDLNQDEDVLAETVRAKIAAQKKLRAELVKMATVLGDGKTTIPEYLKSNSYSERKTDEEILAEIRAKRAKAGAN